MALSAEPLDHELLDHTSSASGDIPAEWTRILRDRTITLWRWLPDTGEMECFGALACQSREDWLGRIHRSDREKVSAFLDRIQRAGSELESIDYRIRIPGREGFVPVSHGLRSGSDHRRPVVTGLISPAPDFPTSEATPNAGEAWPELVAAWEDSPDLLSHFPALRSALSAAAVYLFHPDGEGADSVLASSVAGETGSGPTAEERLEELAEGLDLDAPEYRKGVILPASDVLSGTGGAIFLRTLAPDSFPHGSVFLSLFDDRTEAETRLPSLRIASSFLLQSLALQEERARRETAEGMLDQSQRLTSVGRLASGVAHDFNNLLTVIQGHTSFIEIFAENAEDPKVLESLQLLRGATEKAVELTRQLLLFSRKNEIRFEASDLNGIVSDFVKMMRRMVEENIEFILELDDSAGSIEADRGMIGQILMNLIVNARDAMPSGGTIRIRTETTRIENGAGKLAPGDYVVLTLADTGTGISPDHLARIFDPFFSTKEKGKGSGLGLANVAALVRQHGGQIDVSSTPGEGTEFEILFPQSSPRTGDAGEGSSTPVAPAKSLAGPDDSESIRGTKVLLVEDESAVRKLVRKLLEMQGCEVVEAESGKRALDLWPDIEKDISVVVSDVIMPEGVSGWDLARELHDRSPDTPILLTSGYSERPEDHGLGDVSQVAFLQKPYEATNLKRNIFELLQPVTGS